MLAEERKAKIIELLNIEKTLTVQELSKRLEVSEMTIRRDLLELDKNNLVRRIHGGATVLPTVVRQRVPFNEREMQGHKEKAAIARKTAELVNDGETIILDIGTTTLLVARHLKEKSNLLVVTNSLQISGELAGIPGIRVLLLGGYVHDGAELSIVGSPAIEMLSGLRVDKAIIGAAGLHPERGLVNFDIEEAAVRKAMIRSARKVIVVADHSKMDRDSLVSVCPLSSIHCVVTNEGILEEHVEMLRRNAVEVIVAS